jgi:hypothetical protein
LTDKEPKLEQKESDAFKFQMIYLAPILASVLFGLVCAALLLPQQIPAVPVTPIPTDTPGADWITAAYFVVLVGVSATVFYVLLKRRSKRVIKALITLAFTLAALLLSYEYLLALTFFIHATPNWLIIIPLMVLFTVLFDLAIFKFGNIYRNVAVILMGGALGMFFGYNVTMLSLWSAVLILVFLAVYDIFAVYKGSVGKIAQNGLDDLQGLTYAFKDIQMGLGDLVFYSMLVGAMVFGFQSSFIPAIASIIGILAGSIITFYMLEKKGIFPGLPFPIMLGLILGLATGFLL